MTALAAKSGETYCPIQILSDGPNTSVAWCFPVVPGVLIANSSYVIGPLYGRGGVKVVIFYGFGSFELVTVSGWVS